MVKRFVNPKVHGNDYWLLRFYPDGKVPYEKRDDTLNCRFCGSLSPEDAIKRLNDPNVDASGSDWKYGWPHKFYISLQGSHGKFYSRHLYDASPEVFNELTNLLATKLGIRFAIDDKGLSYKAPYGGFQTWTHDLYNIEKPKVPENW